MEHIGEKIEWYHHLFLGCLILSVLCLAVTVVLFFVLDIGNVLGYLTGKQARKKIRELEEESAKSGRLRAKERFSMQYMMSDINGGIKNEKDKICADDDDYTDVVLERRAGI